MEKYIVTGMSCAACQSRVEKAVSNVTGVTSCSVSLLTNTLQVEGDADKKDILKAVEAAGYGIANNEEKNKSFNNEDILEDRETPQLKKRLLYSCVFLVALMMISMGHMIFGSSNLYAGINSATFIKLALIEMFLSIVIMLINRKFFTSGLNAIIHKSPNMDTLVALGSIASFVYSAWILFQMIDSLFNQQHAMVEHHFHNLYFETAAMIPTLITVGKTLESISKGKTTDALKSLIKLTPKTATVLRDGKEIEINVSDVLVGDIFVVKPGESIPIDGVIIEGLTTIDESSLTGESIPVDKMVDDVVSAATINQNGYFKARATRVGEDTTISQIIKMVSEASSSKPDIARIADTVSAYFVPFVLIVSLITFITWLIQGQTIDFAIARAIAVLVISCPCALGLATPVAIMVGNGIGFKNGILFKTAVSLEQTSKMDVVVLDKTGTITTGKPVVTDVLAADSYSNDYLIKLSASLEQYSEHPLALAINDYAKNQGVKLEKLIDFEALPGNGVRATLNGDTLVGGSLKYISELIELDDKTIEDVNNLSNQGKTPLLFLKNSEYVGLIAVADTVKEDSKKAIKQLHDLGLKVIMLTGDNQKTADYIAKQVGIDETIAQVLPNEKEAVISELKKEHKVIMVGDGINDAVALTSADIGIAIGSGTDVSIDAADIVLTKSTLLDVPAAIRLSRYTLKNIYENLFWAFFYNVICIPLAAGLYQSIFHWNWEMNPMIGAAAMSLSSVTVCLNALRLNTVKIYDSSKDKFKNFKGKEINNMKKTLLIDGMMCEHCENSVKKALENIDGVVSAKVSHLDGQAVVELSKDVDENLFKAAVEEKDYKFMGVK